jgi:2-succinyl-5-enolpyruvyl-6-hydroxy-3-cyclohexene-1-carboxylate synthase
VTPAVNRNQLWARALVDELARAGVTDVVVSPGSRSTPLVLAFAGDPRFRITVQVDERCGGFLALGMGRGSGRPAVVVTTSGTAGANLYPAVVEASQGEVPLLVLTADRPHALRDSDANQAIDQIRLFGPFVRAFHEVAPPTVEDGALRHLRMLVGRAVASASGAPAGPVHLNLPFEKPLEPTPVPGDIPDDFETEYPLAASGRPDGEAPFVRVASRTSRPTEAEVAWLEELLAAARRPVLVAGPLTACDRVGPALQRFSLRMGVPLLADPLSGGRYGAAEGTPVTAFHDLVLRSPRAREVLRPDLVIRVGASPTSVAVLGWLGGLGAVRQVVVDGGGRWKDHLAVASDMLPVDPGELLDRVGPGDSTGSGGAASRQLWLELWQSVGEAAAGAVQEDAGAPFEGTVLAATARAISAGGELYISSSMPVRDLDAFVPPRPQPLWVRGNRGASGIDGIVSTALGVRLATTGPMVAVLGDLACYHDMNGLLAVRNSWPDLVFVVIQNDGGGIFHLLPIRDHEPAFTPYFATPQGLDFSRVAALYDLPHRLVPAGADTVESEVARALEAGGPWILEVRTDREENRRRHREVEAAVVARVQAVLEGAGPG